MVVLSVECESERFRVSASTPPNGCLLVAPVPDSLREYYSGCFTVKASNGLWVTYLLLLVYETGTNFICMV
jgi:hypothetical protein